MCVYNAILLFICALQRRVSASNLHFEMHFQCWSHLVNANAIVVVTVVRHLLNMQSMVYSIATTTGYGAVI